MPLRSERRVDMLLGNVSVKYRNTRNIADKVFPVVPVKKVSDLYRIYDRNFRIPETRRANKGKSREFQFHVSTASYLLEKHALKDYISKEDQENFDKANLRADTVEELTDAIDRRREKDVADLFTTTSFSNVTSLTSTAAWNLDTLLSNPIPVMDTAQSVIMRESGQKANFGIVVHDAFIGAKNHQSVLDRVKYTSADMTPKMLAALFDLEELLIPNSSFDQSVEGLTNSITSIWGDIAFVGFRPRRPGPKIPSVGYIFQQSIQPVRRWVDEERDFSEAIEVQKNYKVKIVSSLSGYLIKDVI